MIISLILSDYLLSNYISKKKKKNIFVLGCSTWVKAAITDWCCIAEFAKIH